MYMKKKLGISKIISVAITFIFLFLIIFVQINKEDLLMF